MSILNLLEKNFCTRRFKNLPPQYESFFDFYFKENFSDARAAAQMHFKSSSEPLEKAFWLNMICNTLEMDYDLPTRETWLRQWQRLELEMPESYILTAKNYHRGITCYFNCYFSEALEIFKSIAVVGSHPARFRALSFFHLGLIYTNIQEMRLAHINFEEAAEIAAEIGHSHLLKRIKAEQRLLEKNSKYSFLDSELVELISNQKFREARQLYLLKTREDRKKGKQREREALHAVLPALEAGLGRAGQALNRIGLITDESIKSQALDLMRAVNLNFEKLDLLKKEIDSRIGVKSVQPASSGQSKGGQIFGQTVGQIEDQELAQFAQLLLDHKNLNKEMICSRMWNYDYDPVSHDGRIYRLIFRFRNYFGRKDIIVNKYGTYEINSAYRAS